MVLVAAPKKLSVAIGSYHVVDMWAAYSLSGMAMWSHTPTNPSPAASAAWVMANRSSTAASASHGCRIRSLRV